MREQLERARVATLLFYGVMVLLAYYVFRLFEPFLAPLAWAGVFVICFYPLHRRLEQRVGRSAAAALSTLAVTLLLVLPAVALGGAFAREARNAVTTVETALTEERFASLERWWSWAIGQVPGYQPADLEALIRDAGTRAGTFVAARAGGFVADAFAFLFDLIIMLFATFFLFRDAGVVVRALRQVLPFGPNRTQRVLQQARDLIYASVIAGLSVAAVQGAIGGIAFAVLGLGAPVFWGVVMAFFSLIPILGAWVIWVPAAVGLMLGGSVAKGLVLVGIGAGVVGLVDNVLRPLLLSGRAEMNGLLILVSLLGGVGVFGLLGLVLGPVIIATAITLFQAYTASDDEPVLAR